MVSVVLEITFDEIFARNEKKCCDKCFGQLRGTVSQIENSAHVRCYHDNHQHPFHTHIQSFIVAILNGICDSMTHCLTYNGRGNI